MVLRGASMGTIGIISNRQARGPANVRHTQNNQAPISIDPDRCTQNKLRSKCTRACFVGGRGVDIKTFSRFGIAMHIRILPAQASLEFLIESSIPAR